MTWWQRLWRGKRLEEKLGKELRFHLDRHASDLMARGYDPQEARRLARIALGGPELVAEDCRDARGTRWIEDLGQDIRYALRALRQKPGFAAVALLTLALGGGATTVMFTVVNGVLLKPLPYPEPEKLVTLTAHANIDGYQYLSYLDFLDAKETSQSLQATAGWVYDGGTVSEPGDPNVVELRRISFNLFSTLGVSLYRGRAFLPEEDRPGAAPVAILSYGFWQSKFAGNTQALGRSIVLDGKRYTVVGVAPRGFHLDGDDDVYTLLGQNTAPYLRDRRAHPVRVWARLKPHTTLVQAQKELALIGRHLEERYPKSNAGRSFEVRPLRPDTGDVGSTLWLLLGAVCLVLLIACANVASLLLARAVSRERELAMRTALGASRGRLIRQCLTESAVLGFSGGLLGVVLATAGIRPFIAFWPGALPRAEEVHLDWRVLLFAALTSLMSGLVFGLAPALRSPVRDLEQKLRAGSRTVAGGSRHLHSGFVVSEIALAVVLLVAAGMLGRTLLTLSALDPGVDIHNVLVTRMALSPATLANTPAIHAAWQDVLDRAKAVPGVESIALVDTVPMRKGNNQLGYWTTAALPPPEKQPVALATSVTPDYLKVMGIPLRDGRFFDDRDRLDSELTVVIDDVLARQAFNGRPAVGSFLWIPDMNDRPARVVGVVGHVRHWGLAGDDQAQIRAQLYYPFAQVQDRFLRRWSELMSIAVRTGIEPLNLVAPLRGALRGASGDQVLYQVRTMERLASESLARQRFLMLLFGIFAGVALLLACIGIYGVLAYLTGQRIPEIGVRMALGANAREVIWLVLRQSLGMIFLGVGVGAAGALAAGRVLQRLVDGMQAAEASAFAATIPLLVAAALLASFLPARRASRIDPISVLRQD